MAFKGDLDALVLGVLQQGEGHGYEILKRIRQLSADVLAVAEGQLYPVLHRLEKLGFVAATWIPQEGKPARKVYVLTDSGATELEAQRKEWSRFTRGVEAIINAKGAKEGR